MIEVTEKTNPYVACFEKSKDSLPGNELPWLASERQKAMDRFAHLGFPTTKHEDWRFTNIKPVASTSFTESQPQEGAFASDPTIGIPLIDTEHARVVLVNGFFRADLSKLENLPDGITVKSLKDALKEDANLLEAHLTKYARYADHAFVALNTALFQDGVFVHVKRGKVIETPLLIFNVTTESAGQIACHPRCLIIAEEASQATVMEAYTGSEGSVYLNNPVTEIYLAQNAVVDHYKLQQESEKAFHIATLQVHQERTSNFANQNIVYGGAIARNDISATLAGEGIVSTVNGLTVGGGTQILDNHTFIDHAMPHCNSYEVYKTVLDEKAKGVFNGRIMVAQDAQKTDAKQTNQNLLLSGEATINTKPQLEIFADDVRCTHGATIGQLDSEAIFYLRTRGINEDAAKSILTYAFAGYVLERIKIETLREHVESVLCDRLPMGDLVRGAL